MLSIGADHCPVTAPSLRPPASSVLADNTATGAVYWFVPFYGSTAAPDSFAWRGCFVFLMLIPLMAFVAAVLLENAVNICRGITVNEVCLSPL